MALDRQSIEKRDFPIGRRGYEPEAVDAHLAELADQIEQLQRSAQRRSGASLAQAAAAQVRAIVEAAEQSAAAIEQDAEAEAQRIRAEAQREAQRTDAEAVERSREHVARVGEQSGVMLTRLGAMEEELGTLIDSLRQGSNRLKADLSLLETNMEDLYTASGGTAGAAGPAAGSAAPPTPSAPAAPQVEPPARPVVIEATLPRPERDGVRGHITPHEAGEHAKRANVKRAVLVHISDELDHLWAEDCASKAFGAPVTVASEGDVFDLAPTAVAHDG